MVLKGLSMWANRALATFLPVGAARIRRLAGEFTGRTDRIRVIGGGHIACHAAIAIRRIRAAYASARGLLAVQRSLEGGVHANVRSALRALEKRSYISRTSSQRARQSQ